MKVLVTGSEGYIGKHLCKMLESDSNYDVERLDLEIIPNFKEKHHINIKNTTYLSSLQYKKYDAVIHLAALVQVGESVDHPTDYYETNITGTLNVLKYITYDNFIFASTGAAETPDSPYGLSKRVSEDIVKEHTKGKKSTIFRFYNVIGSDGFQPTNPDGLFYNLIQAAKLGTFNLYGDDYDTKDGTCVREYVHVNDICLALIKALHTPSLNIENLAYGDTKTVSQIIDIFKEVNSVDFKVLRFPRRMGDLVSCYLKNPSSYMERNYTYHEMLKIP